MSAMQLDDDHVRRLNLTLPSPGENQGLPETYELFDILTARELYQLPDPPDGDQLLGPLLVRRYRTVIAGGTGEGKTTLSLQAISAFIHQRTLLDWEGTGGHVLIIDLEQGLRTIKRRLREADLHQTDQLDYWRIPDGLDLGTNEAHGQAVEAVISSGRYDLVLLDPVYKAHRGDSNDERAIIDLMRLLDRWREQYGFALLLPMHTRKRLDPKARMTIDDIFGSSAAVRGAEIVLGLQRLSDGYSRLYAFKDRDGDALPVGQDPWGLLFNQDGGFHRDPGETAKTDDLRARIIDYLAEHPAATTNDITSNIEGARTTISNILNNDPRFTRQTGPRRSHVWHLTDHHPTLPNDCVGESATQSDAVAQVEGERLRPVTTQAPPKGGPVTATQSPSTASEIPDADEDIPPDLLDWR